MLSESEKVKIEDKLSLFVGIAHLGICTVFLAIGSYIGIEMWLVSLCAVISLFIFNIIIAIFRKKKPEAFICCLKRAPYQLVPFVLSMFVIIVVLGDIGFTEKTAALIGEKLPIIKYGISSFLSANIINNIPMSVLFSSIIAESGSAAGLPAVFATVIGSNIGAFFTPIGALAGIMWSSIIGKHGVKFGYTDFLKVGFTVAVPTLAASLLGLFISFLIF